MYYLGWILLSIGLLMYVLPILFNGLSKKKSDETIIAKMSDKQFNWFLVYILYFK